MSSAGWRFDNGADCARFGIFPEHAGPYTARLGGPPEGSLTLQWIARTNC
jgi:hypothetical protein